MDAITRKGGLLYPMLVIAAISVIVFSAMGIATMMGWLPGELGGSDPVSPVQRPSARSDLSEQRPAAAAFQAGTDTQPAARSYGACAGCGVVVSIRAGETPGETSWLGAAGGAVVGGLGHQVESGGSRTAATVIGAGAGAHAGNEIEKHVSESVHYRVRVRLEDGTYRTFHEAARPAYAVGQSVRVTDDRAVVPLEERRASVVAK